MRDILLGETLTIDLVPGLGLHPVVALAATSNNYFYFLFDILGKINRTKRTNLPVGPFLTNRLVTNLPVGPFLIYRLR